MLFKSKVNK